MTTHLRKWTSLISCLIAFSGIAAAQQQQTTAAEKVPIMMQIVISRYQNDKKISSLPFTFLMITNSSRTNIQNGAAVPVQSTSPRSADATYSYTNIGTNIDCSVASEGGKFRVELSINDRSVMDEESPNARPGATNGPIVPPVTRNFTVNNVFLMKDGETKQFVSAPDRTVGDVTKVDVTLTTEK